MLVEHYIDKHQEDKKAKLSLQGSLFSPNPICVCPTVAPADLRGRGVPEGEESASFARSEGLPPQGATVPPKAEKSDGRTLARWDSPEKGTGYFHAAPLGPPSPSSAASAPLASCLDSLPGPSLPVLLDTGEYLNSTGCSKAERTEETKTDQEKEAALSRLQREVVFLLRRAGCNEEADKVENCGSRGLVFKNKESGEYKGMLSSCDSRWCPRCNTRRVARIMERYEETLLESEGDPVFLTFTQRDVPGETLRDARARLMDAFTRLRRSYWWRESCLGGLYSVEYTEKIVNSVLRSWHLHIHCIAFMNHYFLPFFRHLEGEKENGYLPRLESALVRSDAILAEVRSSSRRGLAVEAESLRQEYLRSTTINELWYRSTRAASQECSRRGYDPGGAYIVWASEVKTDSISEIVKYSTKPLTLSESGLAEAVRFLSGSHIRLLGTFGEIFDGCDEVVEKEAEYAFVGAIDTLSSVAQSYAEMAETEKNQYEAQRCMDRAVNRAFACVSVLIEGVGMGGWRGKCWDRQAVRFLEAAKTWPPWLFDEAGGNILENILEGDK